MNILPVIEKAIYQVEENGSRARLVKMNYSAFKELAKEMRWDHYERMDPTKITIFGVLIEINNTIPNNRILVLER